MICANHHIVGEGGLDLVRVFLQNCPQSCPRQGFMCVPSVAAFDAVVNRASPSSLRTEHVSQLRFPFLESDMERIKKACDIETQWR
jgi:hypothetical protein